MRHRIITLLLGLAVLVTAGCGFHLRGTTQIPPELQKLQISTGDPYGEQTRAIRQQLLLNNVQIIEGGDATIPVLRSPVLPKVRKRQYRFSRTVKPLRKSWFIT